MDLCLTKKKKDLSQLREWKGRDGKKIKVLRSIKSYRKKIENRIKNKKNRKAETEKVLIERIGKVEIKKVEIGKVEIGKVEIGKVKKRKIRI